ncbi:MAG: hypothetical protein V2A58_01625, partial [Planctomycetota bacterium]
RVPDHASSPSRATNRVTPVARDRLPLSERSAFPIVITSLEEHRALALPSSAKDYSPCDALSMRLLSMILT